MLNIVCCRRLWLRCPVLTRLIQPLCCAYCCCSVCWAGGRYANVTYMRILLIGMDDGSGGWRYCSVDSALRADPSCFLLTCHRLPVAPADIPSPFWTLLHAWCWRLNQLTLFLFYVCVVCLVRCVDTWAGWYSVDYIVVLHCVMQTHRPAALYGHNNNISHPSVALYSLLPLCPLLRCLFPYLITYKFCYTYDSSTS